MRPDQLNQMVRNIRNSFGKADVSQEIKSFLFRKLGNIPEESAEWIEEHFTRFYPKYPETLHTAVLHIFREWRNAHPEKKAFENRTCQNETCINGWLYLAKQERLFGEGKYGHFVAACGDCKRAELGRTVPIWTLDEAKQFGYQPMTREIEERMRSPFEPEKWLATAGKRYKRSVMADIPLSKQDIVKGVRKSFQVDRKRMAGGDGE